MSDYKETFTIEKRSPTSRPNEVGGVWAIGYDKEGKYFALTVYSKHALLQRTSYGFMAENTFNVRDWRIDGTALLLTLVTEDDTAQFAVRMGAHALELEGKLLPLSPEKHKTAITDETGALIGYVGTDGKPRLFERMGYDSMKPEKPVYIREDLRALVIPRSKLIDVKTDARGVILEIA